MPDRGEEREPRIGDHAYTAWTPRKTRCKNNRTRERERTRDREVRAAADPKPVDANNPYQAYAATAQGSADRLTAGYTVRTLSRIVVMDDLNMRQDYGRTQASQPTTAATSVPWYGLTAGGRTVPTHAPSPAVDAGYPSASDREDPPLPIPPPGHNRERSSSKTHRSRPQVLAQQAGQDSGISSSEQEHSVRERVSPTFVLGQRGITYVLPDESF